MKIRETLLHKKIHTKAQANIITDYACLSIKHFKELMECLMDTDYRVAQRAAWSVNDAVSKQPKLIEPYIKDVVMQLTRTDVHNAVIRNSVRILEKIEIPEAFHGEVMNACFSFIEKPVTPVAIKAFALTALYNLSKYYPEIKNELKTIIQERFENETAAFKSRGKKILLLL